MDSTPSASRPRAEALWRLGEQCNFRCDYCFRDGRRADGVVRWDADAVAASLDRTGRRWRLHLTGGEPFLHPDILPLCRALARDHELSINTNLSTDNVLALTSTVSPRPVHSINASIHVVEREKHGGGVEQFLDLLLEVQRRGFRIRLFYVVHPALWSRMARDLDHYRNRGVNEIYLKLFRGRHSGRTYPRAYSRAQRGWLVEHGLPPDEQNLFTGARFIGRLCGAGQSGFSIGADGSVTRCDGVADRHGHLLDGVRFESGPRPCPRLHCTCPYQGYKWTLPERSRSREAFTFARWMAARGKAEVLRRFSRRRFDSR